MGTWRLTGFGAVLGLVLALPLAIGAAGPAAAAKCDYSGFEKPCVVGDGDYRVLLPEGEGPFPAMVYLHGTGGRSVTIANHPLFEAAVAGRGYALIVPTAREMDYRPGYRDTGWTLRHEGEPVRDEVAFLREVIADAARRFPVDPERVLMAGQSRGGFLIWEIACHEPDLAAAYAVHAGSYIGPLPRRCRQPVRFLQTHGVADTVVPFRGLARGDGLTRVTPVPEALELMARTNGCTPEPAGAPEPVQSFARQRWEGCAPGGELALMLHKGGHGMPSSWFRAVLDWFETPLPEAPDTAPLRLRIGQGLPNAARPGAEADAPGPDEPVPPATRFKAPPAPGEPALSGS